MSDTQTKPEPTVTITLTAEEVATMMNAMAFSLALFTDNPMAAETLKMDLMLAFIQLGVDGYQALVDRMSAASKLAFAEQITLKDVPRDQHPFSRFGGENKNEHVA